MNKTQVIVVALLLIAHAGFASADTGASTVSPDVHQQKTSSIKKIAPDNPDRKIVEAAIQEVVSRYKKPLFEGARMATPMQVETSALTGLFPKHRFYLISWDIITPKHATPESRMWHYPCGLYFTLVVRPEGRTVKLDGYGNYEDFGSLLHENAIKVKSDDDAKLIWTAFNDAHQKQWFGERTHRQVSLTEWAVGENQIDNFRYWYRITLDAEQTVISAKLMAEKVDKAKGSEKAPVKAGRE